MSLDFRTTLDDSQFQGTLRSMTGAAQRAGDRIESATAGSAGRMGKLWGGLGGAIAGAVSIGAIVGGTKAMMDFTGGLEDASANIGINVEQLQRLQQAFSLGSGASTEETDKALVKLSQSIQDAVNGNEKLGGSFTRMGISAQDLKRLPVEQILIKMSGAASTSADKSQVLSDSMDLLGKAGSKLVGTLMKGPAELQASMDGATVATEGTIAAIGMAADANERAMAKLRANTANALGEAIRYWTETKDGASDYRDFIISMGQIGGLVPMIGDAVGIGSEYKGPEEDIFRKQSDPAKRIAAIKKAIEENNARLQGATDQKRIRAIEIQNAKLEDSLKTEKERLAAQGNVDKDRQATEETKEKDAAKWAKERADGEAKAEKEIQLGKMKAELATQQKAEDLRTGKAFAPSNDGEKRPSLASNGLGPSGFDDGGLFSTRGQMEGVKNRLSEGARPTLSMGKKEREEMERKRVEAGLGRSVSSTGGYGAVRRGDKKMRAEAEKREQEKKKTVEGSNELLDRILKLQEEVWKQ